MGGGVTVDGYDRLADLDAGEWDRLVDAARAPVFYSTRYLDAYEREPLAAVDAVRYLVARSGGEPVAAAPLYLYRQLDPLGRVRLAYPLAGTEAGLLSHVWHCYDTQLPAGPGGRAGEVVAAVVAAAGTAAREHGAPWFGFVNVEHGTPTHRALTAAGLPAHHIEDRFATDVAGVADLDDYLARLGGRARANLTRNRRRAVEAGATVAVCPASEADLAEAAALCRRTAARFGNGAFYPHGAFERFVASLGSGAPVIEVRQGGRLVAVGICLLDVDRFHTWTCGVDYAVAGNFSPYAVLFTESVALALRLGRPVLEGGRRNAAFKQRHGLAVRHLDACLLPA